jgi:voltage-gated potassium channel
MSGLALVFLILAAVSLRHIERSPQDTGTSDLLVALLLSLWLPLFIDALVGYWRRADFTWPAARRLLLLWLIPPFRIAQSPYAAESCVWLPALGWQRADQDLYERLERAFSIPMLFMAILILPILAAELFWAEEVAGHAGVRLALDLGTAVIWLAFCVEFIVMSTLAPKKLVYLARNWINLAIIVMPFLAFLRGLKVGRVLWLGKGLGKAVKTLKVYRLRGLWMRGWRGMVALDLLERVVHRTPERRLRRLREILAERERDISRLRGRIGDLEAEVRAAATKGDDPG